ncbi:23S rRNA (guanosine(2251)-2'-O)-methyltransferase RlmB [Acidobacteria bacterium AH-259-D05]|nr:23S rRNA (guanosine(2251)-2'-O)-methyltransferase RlmB [Acidobacteria bacterium AH-259-D05]
MIIFGINPVSEALQSRSNRPECIWITRGKPNPRLQKILELAQSCGVRVRFESSQAIAKKALTDHHQEIAAEISEISYTNFETLLQSQDSLLLLVDGVEDPRNLGALLRTAEATGVEGVLIPSRHSCSITPAVIKSSAGAAIHLSISRIGNVVRALEQLKKQGYWVVGLDMLGKDSVNQIDVDEQTVVVVGGEHQGMRRLVREHCDFLVSLPMKGRVTSLNLSVAAGVLLYEIALKRKTADS